MQDVRLGDIVLILAYILKSTGRAIVSIADDHLVLDDQCPHLAALAITILSPDTCHSEVSVVKLSLLLLLIILF